MFSVYSTCGCDGLQDVWLNEREFAKLHGIYLWTRVRELSGFAQLLTAILMSCFKNEIFLISSRLILVFFLISSSSAHEGSAGLSWNLSASVVKPTDPDCFLPGTWAQRCSQKLLLRSEDPCGHSLPEQARRRIRDEKLWVGSGGPFSETGK